MNQPEDKIYESFARLAASPDMRRVMDWLQELLDSQDIQNRSTTGEVLYRGQGIAVTLAHILEAWSVAPSVIRDRNS
jgi:hypothetical protein